MAKKEKYLFEGVALRRKVISSNKDKCLGCFFHLKNCLQTRDELSEEDRNYFIYDCCSRPNPNTSYIFVKK